MKRLTIEQYNDALDFITHLILTKPTAVRRLLARFNIHFKSRPNGRQLINEVVRMLSKNNLEFNRSLSNLISIHIFHKGKDMMAMEKSLSNSDDDNYDEFWGAVAGLAGKAIGGIAGLFGKKKKSGGGGAAAAIAAQQRAAAAQAARMKADMDAKMRQMQMEQQRRAEEARRRREEEDRRRRDAEANAAKKKGGNSNVLLFGGLAAAALVGVVLFSMKSKQPAAPVVVQKV